MTDRLIRAYCDGLRTFQSRWIFVACVIDPSRFVADLSPDCFVDRVMHPLIVSADLPLAQLGQEG